MQRHIEFEQLVNFRDLGGYPIADGHSVRWGRLYRSDSLGRLAGADWDRFLGLGVRTVIDLRYPFEIEANGRVPEHATLAYHNLSIEHGAYDQTALDPSIDPAEHFAEKHIEVAHDGVKEIRQALEVIADPESGPVAFHCAAGKDRTGLLAAIILGLIGVGDEEIIADYALSERATERLRARWIANHPGRPVRWRGYGYAPPDAMRRFLAEIAARYGSIQGYASAQLGTDESLVSALRERLVSDGR